MDLQNVYVFPLLIFSVFIVIKCSSLSHYYDYQELYGDGYGTKWIYFPDGYGVLHYINLTSAEYNVTDTRILKSGELEFRLYIGNDTESYIKLNKFGKPIRNRNNKIALDVLTSDMPLKVITHGWRSSVDRHGVLVIRNAYLKAQTANVIALDWSSIADSLLYHWVANETKTVGSQLAVFLDALSHRYNLTGEKMHLIGHSLGAHIMGVAASKTNISINRVTGLDPARPFFEYPPQDDSARLDSTDAEFVDVIHTCGGLLGVEAAVGTVDFYPNNGIAPQPGCDSIFNIFDACSHGRSFLFFSESIKYPKSFPAYHCKTWKEFLENKCHRYGYMGEYVNRNMTGKYYLKTNAFEPFGILKI